MSILLDKFLQNEPFLLCCKIFLQQTMSCCLRRFPNIRVTPLCLHNPGLMFPCVQKKELKYV